VSLTGKPENEIATEELEPFELYDVIKGELTRMGYEVKDNEKKEFEDYANSYKSRAKDATNADRIIKYDGSDFSAPKYTGHTHDEEDHFPRS